MNPLLTSIEKFSLLTIENRYAIPTRTCISLLMGDHPFRRRLIQTYRLQNWLKANFLDCEILWILAGN